MNDKVKRRRNQDPEAVLRALEKYLDERECSNDQIKNMGKHFLKIHDFEDYKFVQENKKDVINMIEDVQVQFRVAQNKVKECGSKMVDLSNEIYKL